VDLLAERAVLKTMHPFMASEIGVRFFCHVPQKNLVDFLNIARNKIAPPQISV